MDAALYREVVERIRSSGSDVLINLTTGPGARFIPGADEPLKAAARQHLALPATRVRHVVELKPDICSLDMGSMNMGGQVFVNTPAHLEAMAVAIRDAGVTPELEVFEAGHLMLARKLIETGHVKSPGLFQICLGISWGQPATSEAVSYMRSLLPSDCVWFAFGISLHQFPIAAQTVLLGGHVRVGLEDNLYLEKGKLTPSNAALVEKAAKHHRGSGRSRRHAGRRAPDAGNARRLSFRYSAACCDGGRIDSRPSAAVAEIVVRTISRASCAGHGRPRCMVARLSHITTSPLFHWCT